MRAYVEPKSLMDKHKRYALRSTSKFGAKIIIEVLERRPPYYLALISVEGNQNYFSFLRNHGVKLSKKPKPVLLSRRVIAELHVDPSEGVLIGYDLLGMPLRLSLEKLIITTLWEVAYFLASNVATLWIDFRGSSKVINCGFKELLGLPLKIGTSRLQDLAFEISRTLNIPIDTVMGALGANDLLTDDEVGLALPSQLQDLFRWGILDRDARFSAKSYIDFSGLPEAYWSLVTRIVDRIWDGLVIYEVPRLDNNFLGHKTSNKIILVPNINERIGDIVVLRRKIIWNIRVGRDIIPYEVEYKAICEDS